MEETYAKVDRSTLYSPHNSESRFRVCGSRVAALKPEIGVFSSQLSSLTTFHFFAPSPFFNINHTITTTSLVQFKSHFKLQVTPLASTQLTCTSQSFFKSDTLIPNTHLTESITTKRDFFLRSYLHLSPSYRFSIAWVTITMFLEGRDAAWAAKKRERSGR